jgi:uncharacterized protein YdaL
MASGGVIGRQITFKTRAGLYGQILGFANAFWIFSIVKALFQAGRNSFRNYFFFIDA